MQAIGYPIMCICLFASQVHPPYFLLVQLWTNVPVLINKAFFIFPVKYKIIDSPRLHGGGTTDYILGYYRSSTSVCKGCLF